MAVKKLYNVGPYYTVSVISLGHLAPLKRGAKLGARTCKWMTQFNIQSVIWHENLMTNVMKIKTIITKTLFEQHSLNRFVSTGVKEYQRDLLEEKTLACSYLTGF